MYLGIPPLKFENLIKSDPLRFQILSSWTGRIPWAAVFRCHAAHPTCTDCQDQLKRGVLSALLAELSSLGARLGLDMVISSTHCW